MLQKELPLVAFLHQETLTFPVPGFPLLSRLGLSVYDLISVNFGILSLT
jgi:hypothetical protein